MRKWKNLRKKEDGVTLIIIALSMTAIMSMMALVLDLGLAFYNRAQLQASCDSAALAAARYMNDKSGPTEATLTQNGIRCFSENFSTGEITKYTITNPEATYKYSRTDENSKKNDTVETRATMESPTAFARIFGIDSIKIGVYAEAINSHIPDPNSVYGKAVVAKENLYFTGKQNIDSVYCDGDIDFKFNHSVVNDAIVSGGKISGTGNMDLNGVHVSEDNKQCDIDADIKNTEKYIDTHLKPSTGDLIFETESPKTDENDKWPSGWDGTMNEVTLNERKAYKVNVDIKATAIIKHDLYIKGNINVLNTLEIKEGVTVYVTGNCTVGSGLVCDGNLIVLGNLHATGAKFTSHTKTPKDNFSYVYVGGTAASFGQAADQCDNIIICAPNVDYFEITGGGTDFVGTIIGKNLSGGLGPNGYNYTGLGSGNLTVRRSDSIPPDQVWIDQFRLSK